MPAELSPETKTPPVVGKVYLVGAGPGDPGLLTLKGLRCLQQADLILYDGLVNPWLVRHGHAAAERTCRLISTEGRLLPQAEINQRLIEAAKSGLCVVRLKGGDPFVFGRGSEEAAALQAEGIPFEVVPGITAATAAAVYSGISLTHRDHASAVALVTGHEDPTKPASALNYEQLAHFPGTLVFYMGLHRLGAICAELIRHGKSPSTPAAVVCRATTPAQQTVSGTLADLPAIAAAAGLHPPSLVIIGNCVAERAAVAWFEQTPLFGLNIAITRATQQADEIGELIWQQGGRPVLLPTIAIEPVPDWTAIDTAIDRLQDYSWVILTSPNGVEAFLGRMWERGRDARAFANLMIAAIGPATAARLVPFGLRADLIPQEFQGEGLAEAIVDHFQSGAALWVRASRGRDVLPEILTQAGIRCDELVAYLNVDVQSWPAAELAMLEQGQVDWVTLTSPSIARQFAHLATPAAWEHLRSGRTRLASLSPITAAAAAEAGLPQTVVSPQATWPELLKTIAQAPPLTELNR